MRTNEERSALIHRRIRELKRQQARKKERRMEEVLEKMKKLDEEHVEKRVAFEVSVSKLELLEEAQVQESIV